MLLHWQLLCSGLRRCFLSLRPGGHQSDLDNPPLLIWISWSYCHAGTQKSPAVGSCSPVKLDGVVFASWGSILCLAHAGTRLFLAAFGASRRNPTGATPITLRACSCFVLARPNPAAPWPKASWEAAAPRE